MRRSPSVRLMPLICCAMSLFDIGFARGPMFAATVMEALPRQAVCRHAASAHMCRDYIQTAAKAREGSVFILLLRRPDCRAAMRAEAGIGRVLLSRLSARDLSTAEYQRA